jgi:heparin binding hemagglutinin HbhA
VIIMPAPLPTVEDVRAAREQAQSAVSATVGYVKTPLLAVLGATDAAVQAVIDGLRKARIEAADRAPDRQARLQQAYSSFAARGEEVFGEFRGRPRVKQAVDLVESGVDSAQGRLETVVRDANDLADELLARFARTSRSTGEKAARRTQKAAEKLAEQVKETSDDLAGAVTEVGDEAASSTRSTTRKAATKVQGQRRPPARRSPTSKS